MSHLRNILMHRNYWRLSIERPEKTTRSFINQAVIIQVQIVS